MKTTDLPYNAPVRNCGNCAHSFSNDFGGLVMKCHKTGRYCSSEMERPSVCGPTVPLWQPKPPRVGLLVRLWRVFFQR